jgi:hypothetical protein
VEGGRVIKQVLGLLAITALVPACGFETPAGQAQASPSQNPLTTPAATAKLTSPAPDMPTIVQLLARCPTPAELASVDALVSMTFTSDPSAGHLVCAAATGSRDLTLLQERGYQAVLMFSWIRFDAPLPWTSLSLDRWFAHAIHGINFTNDAPSSYCCLPGGVIAIQSIGLAALSTSVVPWDSVRWLAALFVHEARHNEGYAHTCTTGPRAGQNDNTIAELGAWGVEYYFTLWLGAHSDPSVIPESLRLEARQEAATFPSRFFCQETASPSP